MDKPFMNMVNPKQYYNPKSVYIPWFTRWTLQCGHCEKDFRAFALFAKPKCPFCGVRNVIQGTWY